MKKYKVEFCRKSSPVNLIDVTCFVDKIIEIENKFKKLHGRIKNSLRTEELV